MPRIRANCQRFLPLREGVEVDQLLVAVSAVDWVEAEVAEGSVWEDLASLEEGWEQ